MSVMNDTDNPRHTHIILLRQNAGGGMVGEQKEWEFKGIGDWVVEDASAKLDGITGKTSRDLVLKYCDEIGLDREKVNHRDYHDGVRIYLHSGIPYVPVCLEYTCNSEGIQRVRTLLEENGISEVTTQIKYREADLSGGGGGLTEGLKEIIRRAIVGDESDASVRGVNADAKLKNDWETRHQEIVKSFRANTNGMLNQDVLAWTASMLGSGKLTAKEVMWFTRRLMAIDRLARQMAENMLKGILKYEKQDWKLSQWREFAMDDFIDSVNYQAIIGFEEETGGVLDDMAAEVKVQRE